MMNTARLTIACEGNNKLIVFNLKTHVVETTSPLGRGPTFWLSTVAYKFSTSPASPVWCLCLNTSDDQLRKIGDMDVGPNSHSVSLDAENA